MRSSPNRRAFTLLELLVAMAIAGILFGLLLAAVQRVREAAARTHCANNLRQSALAMQQFHTAAGFFPNSGGRTPGVVQNPAISTTSQNLTKTWGVGAPNLPPRFQAGSWAYAVLPYLENEPAFRNRTFEVVVSSYMCPTRNRQFPQSVPPLDPYFPGCQYESGEVNPWGKSDFAANLRIVFGDYKTTIQSGVVKGMADITDGTASTILLGEKSLDRVAYNSGGWFWDEPIFAGGAAGGTVRSKPIVQRDARGVDFADSWGASHPAGAQFAFADGSVRLLQYDIPDLTMQALLTPNGSEVVADPR